MSDTQDAINAGALTVRPTRLELGGYYSIALPNGDLRTIDLTGDTYREHPRRIHTHPHFTDPTSLAHYWDRHHTPASSLYANPDQHTITAIFDDHHGAHRDPTSETPDHPSAGIDNEHRADWQNHQATLTMHTSRPLAAWRKHNTLPMTQQDFAEHIEDLMGTIADPPAADLREMAQSFHASVGAEFKAGYRIDNGARVLSYVETVDVSTSGHGGPITAPTHLTLILPIWRDNPTTTRVEATIRYRVDGRAGKLAVSYHLRDIDDIIDTAFGLVCHDLAGHTGVPIYRGRP